MSSKGIAEFDTHVWAQGVAEMIADAEVEHYRRSIEATAEYLKRNFGS